MEVSFTVLLLHAMPMTERMWEPQLEALVEAGYDAKAPRLLGRGDSIAGWAEQLLAETEGDLVVVGASMGGYCALELTGQAPERVRGLMLVGSKASADPPESKEWRDQAMAMAREQGVLALWETMRGYALSPNAPAALIERSNEIAASQDGEEMARAIYAMLTRPHTTHVVHSLSCPFLAVAGELDEGIVAESRDLVDLAGDGELVVVPGAAHLVSFERPEVFNPVLLRFLERVAG